MRRFLLLFPLLIAACDVAAPPPATAPTAAPSPLTPQQAADAFIAVVSRVEPVAERECRRLTAGVNCDFLILVNRDPRAAPNAFQSVADNGQPVVVFTLAMIAEAHNADEMAFVLSHETAHHISGHLARQAQNAATGAAVFAELATLNGGSRADIANAEELGAAVGARSFSKEFELEADRLGTIIAARAGYDPLLGARYFTRIPDPGNQFLGSHPPNAARIEAVRATVRQLGGA